MANAETELTTLKAQLDKNRVVSLEAEQLEQLFPDDRNRARLGKWCKANKLRWVAGGGSVSSSVTLFTKSLSHQALDKYMGNA